MVDKETEDILKAPLENTRFDDDERLRGQSVNVESFASSKLLLGADGKNEESPEKVTPVKQVKKQEDQEKDMPNDIDYDQDRGGEESERLYSTFKESALDNPEMPLFS